MGSFFDDISAKAEARRNMSWDRQKSLIDSGITTPSLTNGSMDNSLTGEQAQAKANLLEQKSREAYSELMALPVGAVEGMVGFGGDIERLGRGIGGAVTADNGNRWDSFLNELGNSDTTLWNTENVQGWTNRQLEGTEFGNRLLEGKGGRLVGEILAPIPPVAGAVKYGGKALGVLDDGVTVANRYLNKFDIQPGLSIKAVDDIPVGAVDDATMAKSLGDRVIRTAENSEHIKPPRFGIDGKPLVQHVDPVMPRNTPLSENLGGYGARYGDGGVHANLTNADDFIGGVSKEATEVITPNGTTQVLTDPVPMQTIKTGGEYSGPQSTSFFDDIQQPTNQQTLIRKADGTVVSTGELSNDVMRNIDTNTAKQLDTIEETPMSNWYDEQSPVKLDAKGKEIESSYKKNIAKINEVADKSDTNFTGDPSFKLKPKSPSAHEKVIESIANNRQELPDVLADNLLRKASDITADTTIDATTKEKLLGRLYEVYDDVTGVNITDGVATNKRYGTNIMERPRNQMNGRRVQEVGGLTDEQIAKPLDTKNTFKQVEDLDDIEYKQSLQDNGITDKIDELGDPVLDSNGMQIKVDADGNDIVNSVSRLADEVAPKETFYKELEQLDEADTFKQKVHNSQRLANITDEPSVATNRQVLDTDGIGRTYKRTEVPDRIIPSLYDELGDVKVRGNTVGKSSMDADFQKARNKQTRKKKSNSKIDDWVRKDKEAQIEGAKRLGLPMPNTPAQRAEKLGFGDTQYHGTDADFTGFKVDPDVNYSHAHISSTPDPQIANHFSKLAGKYPEGAKVYPVRTRGNHFSLKDKESVREVTDMIETQIGFEHSDEAVESVLRDLRSGNAYWKTMEHPMVRKALQFTGYDSFDTAEGVSKVINKANFNPSDVRSPLAHFNPKHAGVGAGSILSADLMAGEITLEEYEEMLKELQKNKGLLND